MPKPVQYRTGSLIYFQGDVAEKIYILQNGKVSLVFQDMETGEDIRDQVQPGEFFGVKSALGRYPREENAVTLADSTIMALSVSEFEALVVANTRIIMKMLKVFSNQLRRVHKQVSKLMAREEDLPADGLYNIGEYYLKTKRFSQAKYVFSSYLTYYPSGKNSVKAAKNLELIENSMARTGVVKAPAVSSKPAAPAVKNGFDSDSAYYDAVSLISKEKYQEALILFKKVMDMDAGSELSEKSAFEIGHCLFLMKKFEECLKYYTSMLTQHPKHSEIKDSMYIMGQCNEKIGRKDQAAAFYKKILTMSSGEEDGTTSKVKRALNALGV